MQISNRHFALYMLELFPLLLDLNLDSFDCHFVLFSNFKHF